MKQNLGYVDIYIGRFRDKLSPSACKVTRFMLRVQYLCTNVRHLVNLDGEDQSETTTEMTMESPKKDDAAELLQYHFKYGHIPFRRLQEMAQQGSIPPRLGKCPILPCATCMFGKAHKQPKQTKSKKSLTDPKEVKAPRDLVSVDVLVSSTPGLIAQMAGFLMCKAIQVCLHIH
jgi:hypothetical protein